MEDHSALDALAGAVMRGQGARAAAVLRDNPGVARADIGIICALYDVAGLRVRLADDPDGANRPVRGQVPIVHLARSRHFHAMGDAQAMLQVARMLLDAGADPDARFAQEPGQPAAQSALYAALALSDNLELAQLLLQAGATPNDGESLYHATELPHAEGVRLLLQHGAVPKGTNALLRALDFDDDHMVDLLLDAGADPNEAGTTPALIHAALRMSGRKCARALIAAGADVRATHQGVGAWAMARVHGNRAIATALEEVHKPDVPTGNLSVLIRAADDDLRPDDALNLSNLPPEFGLLLTRLAARAGTRGHMARLIGLGLDPDRSDESGLSAAQSAGWNGRSGNLAFLLGQGPDLEARNAYGGTLLEAILHGSVHCPDQTGADYARCLSLALAAGAELPQSARGWAEDPALNAIMEDWALRRGLGPI